MGNSDANGDVSQIEYDRQLALALHNSENDPGVPDMPPAQVGGSTIDGDSAGMDGSAQGSSQPNSQRDSMMGPPAAPLRPPFMSSSQGDAMMGPPALPMLPPFQRPSPANRPSAEPARTLPALPAPGSSGEAPSPHGPPATTPSGNHMRPPTDFPQVGPHNPQGQFIATYQDGRFGPQASRLPVTGTLHVSQIPPFPLQAPPSAHNGPSAPQMPYNPFGFFPPPIPYPLMNNQRQNDVSDIQTAITSLQEAVRIMAAYRGRVMRPNQAENITAEAARVLKEFLENLRGPR